MRSLHRWPGVIAAILVVVLALSGAVLSILPASEELRTAQADAGLSVAELTQRVADTYPSVEQIRRAPSGRVTADVLVGDRPEAVVIDPATGRGVGSAETPAFERWVTALH